MDEYQFRSIRNIICERTGGTALNLAQFVRVMHPGHAIDRVILRLIGAAPGGELDKLYGCGRTLNEILDAQAVEA